MSFGKDERDEMYLAMRMLLTASVDLKVNPEVCKAAADAVVNFLIVTGNPDFNPVTEEIARLATGGMPPEQIVDELSRRMTETISEYHRRLLENLCGLTS